MKISILVFIAFFISAFSGNPKKENDLKKANLSGKVELISRESYFLEKSFGETVKASVGQSDKYGEFIGLQDTILYDSIGNLKELKNNSIYGYGFNPIWGYPIWNHYGLKYDPVTIGFGHRLIWKYDNTGKLIEWDGSSPSEDDVNIFENVALQIYRYDTNGNIKGYDDISKLWDHSYSFRHLFKYNDKGNVIENEQYFLDNGSVQGKSLYKYDNYGNMIEDDSYSENTTEGINRSNLITKNVYKYDTVGNLIENDLYYPDDQKIITKITYNYDDKRNLIIESISSLNGLLEKQSNYKYENFDNEGNWLKCTIIRNKYNEQKDKYTGVISNNNVIVSSITYVVERKIEYYQ